MAYKREIIDFFAKLPADVIFEDNILNLRAELLGNAAVLTAPLVNHTNHEGQITRHNVRVPLSILEQRRKLRSESNISSSLENIKDIKAAFQHGRIKLPMYQALLALFEEKSPLFPDPA